MDEAEYCNRVSIMVDGRIDALDTPAQLKETYKAHQWMKCFYNWQERRRAKNERLK